MFVKYENISGAKDTEHSSRDDDTDTGWGDRWHGNDWNYRNGFFKKRIADDD